MGEAVQWGDIRRALRTLEREMGAAAGESMGETDEDVSPSERPPERRCETCASWLALGEHNGLGHLQGYGICHYLTHRLQRRETIEGALNYGKRVRLNGTTHTPARFWCSEWEEQEAPAD
jgi:hypothetical protein